MSPRGGLLWSLAVATLVVYAAMVLWSLPYIAGEAGGLLPFDLRPSGYSEAEARAFLAALSEDGRRFYLGTQHRLDLVYPALLAATLGLAIWRLFPKLPAFARAALALVPAMGSAYDYLENARVAGLLAMGAEATGEAVAAASRATLFKSGLTSAGFALLLLGLVLAGLRRWRTKRKGSRRR